MDSWETYKSVVRDALDEAIAASYGAIPGATLSLLIRKKAAEAGLEFPPGGPLFKFSEFLQSFPDVVKIVPRPGEDFLAIPPQREDLLGARGGMQLIRKDFFAAFTRFDEHSRAWYNQTLDKVIWRKSGEREQDSVPFPPVTVHDEIGVRESFARTIDDKEFQDKCLARLATSSPLSEFSKLIKDLRLQGAWHRYRYKYVLERIKAWAAECSIPFNDDWISAGTRTPPSRQALTLVPHSREQAFLASLGQLSEEDMARISVPLDLVLKILRQLS